LCDGLVVDSRTQNLNRLIALPRSGETTVSTVWHYTDRIGLEGILSSNTLWASDSTTMNDPTELHTGRRAVDEALSMAKLEPRVADGVREHLMFARTVMDRGMTFVLSASRDGDSLAQWRAYADGLKGYAIGFAAREPLNLFDRRPFDSASDRDGHGDVHQYVSVWRDVLYDASAQATEAEALIDLLARLVDPVRYDPALAGFVFNELSVRAWVPPAYAGIVTRLKHPAFASEAEVRITATALDSDRFHTVGSKGRTRVELTGWVRPAQIAGRSTFVSAASAPLPISAVRAGPMCPDDDLRELLDSYGYSAEALASQIPYQ
jgi:hypothetical protein